MKIPIILPDLGEGIVEAEVQRWLVQPGDAVAAEQPVVEVTTDKATVTIPSPRAGRVARLLWNEGEIASVRQPLLELEVEEAAAGTVAAGAPAKTVAASPGAEGPAATGGAGSAGSAGAGAAATPAVRAAAKQRGIDLAAVRGSGPGGRVTMADLDAHLPGARAEAPAAAAGAARGAEEVVPLRGVRRRIAERMALSKRTAAHFTFVEEVDVTALGGARERAAARGEPEGIKVTLLPFIVKAAVAALAEHPGLNASFDEAKGELHVKRWYDVGIATATDDGLLVPVVRGADRLGLLELAREIERLAAGARGRSLRPEELAGSTFTVTSLGALGGLLATPVLNPPEVAILGVHRLRPTPVVRDGLVVVRDVLHLSLTSDHRVVDGHAAAAFTYAVIRFLEEPSLLFAEVLG